MHRTERSQKNGKSTTKMSKQEFQTYLTSERQRLKAERDKLLVYKRPVKTFANFFSQTGDYLNLCGKWLMKHKYVLLLLSVLTIFHLIMTNIPGAHDRYFDWFEDEIFWAAYWISLGVLSSVGLGTGMHSGMLFLFPHIGKVCLAAQECKSLNFDQHGPEAFICPETGDMGEVPFLGLFWKVFWPCFLWGGGTAIGEIPPYAIAYASASAGETIEELEEWQESTKNAPEIPKWNILARFINWMKVWTFEKLHKWRFWGILAFAAWPNMFFDLCGIACGHFLLPFWTFFGATFIGKALIKVNMQSAALITAFNEHMLKRVFQTLPFLQGSIQDAIEEFLEKEKKKYHKGVPQTNGPSTVARLWNVFILLFIGMFVVSVIHSFAQQKQKYYDDLRLKDIEKQRNEKSN